MDGDILIKQIKTLEQNIPKFTPKRIPQGSVCLGPRGGKFLIKNNKHRYISKNLSKRKLKKMPSQKRSTSYGRRSPSRSRSRSRSLRTYQGRKVHTGPDGGKYTVVKGQKRYVPRKARGLKTKKQVSRRGRSNVSKYRHLSRDVFCGPSGGAVHGSYPVTSAKRCRAALSYARFAPRPCGIARCALRKAKKHGWKCGGSSSLARRCRVRPSGFGGLVPLSTHPW